MSNVNISFPDDDIEFGRNHSYCAGLNAGLEAAAGMAEADAAFYYIREDSSSDKLLDLAKRLRKMASEKAAELKLYINEAERRHKEKRSIAS